MSEGWMCLFEMGVGSGKWEGQRIGVIEQGET